MEKKIFLYIKTFVSNLNHKFHENNLTFEDIFNIARNEIEKINPNYLEKFDELIYSGRLDFFNQEKNITISERNDYEKLSQIENSEEETRNNSTCNYTKNDYFLNLQEKFRKRI